MVTKEQVDFFQENGYLKFGRVLDSDGVEAMRAGLDAVIELELTEGDDSSPGVQVWTRSTWRQTQPWQRSPACDTSVCQYVEA